MFILYWRTNHGEEPGTLHLSQLQNKLSINLFFYAINLKQSNQENNISSIQSMYTFHNFVEERMRGNNGLCSPSLHSPSATFTNANALHSTYLPHMHTSSDEEAPCYSSKNRSATRIKDAHDFPNDNILFSPLMHDLTDENSTKTKSTATNDYLKHYNCNFTHHNSMHETMSGYNCAHAHTYVSSATMSSTRVHARCQTGHSQCAGYEYYPSTAAGVPPYKSKNEALYIERPGVLSFLKADDKKAFLEMLPPVKTNNLRGSLRQFELALEMYGVNQDRDKRELALRYFPKFIADVFFETAHSASGYNEIRDIIWANSQNVYACHSITPVDSSNWDPFMVFRQANRMLSCPRDEWQKELITQLSPPVVQNELRLIMDLSLEDFKNRYKAIYNCFKNSNSCNSRQCFGDASHWVQQARFRPSTSRAHGNNDQAPLAHLQNNNIHNNNLNQPPLAHFQNNSSHNNNRRYARDQDSGNGCINPPTGKISGNQGNCPGGR